jgi:hypothetical protein
VKLKITTLAEEERGMNAAGPWEGRGERSQQQRRNDMNNDEEPNNPCWNEKSRAWSRTRGRGGWKAISSHGERGAQEDEEDGRLSAPTVSLQS